MGRGCSVVGRGTVSETEPQIDTDTHGLWGGEASWAFRINERWVCFVFFVLRAAAWRNWVNDMERRSRYQENMVVGGKRG